MKYIYVLTVSLIALFGITNYSHAELVYQGGKCIQGCPTKAERVADWKEACDIDKDVFTEVVACREGENEIDDDK